MKRQWQGTKDSLDSICLTCGKRWGQHFGDNSCPDVEEIRKRNKFWICWVAGTDGGRHYKHDSEKSARIEAERLARLPDVQGKKVYVLERIGQCSAELMPVKWEV